MLLSQNPNPQLNTWPNGIHEDFVVRARPTETPAPPQSRAARAGNPGANSLFRSKEIRTAASTKCFSENPVFWNRRRASMKRSSETICWRWLVRQKYFASRLLPDRKSLDPQGRKAKTCSCSMRSRVRPSFCERFKLCGRGTLTRPVVEQVGGRHSPRAFCVFALRGQSAATARGSKPLGPLPSKSRASGH